MKKLLTVLSVIVALIAGCQSESKKEVQSFQINIIRNPTFSPATHWLIFEDSIVISYVDFSTRQYLSYMHRWTDVEKRQLTEMISQWDLDSFEAKQMGDAPADATSFSFQVRVDSSTYQQYTCMEKIEELFQLAAYLDKSLPQEHMIGYNDEYFTR